MKSCIKELTIVIFILLMLVITFSLVNPVTIAVTCEFTATDPNYGAEILCILPTPDNRSWVDIDNHTLRLNVSNSLGQTINISFYWGNNDTLIGKALNVANNTFGSIIVPFNYVRYQNYSWYVIVNTTNIGSQQSGKRWFKGEAYDWDVGRNEYIDIKDITAVTGHYGETGYAHWIRADTTRSGNVDVNDITLVTGHYGEEY